MPKLSALVEEDSAAQIIFQSAKTLIKPDFNSSTNSTRYSNLIKTNIKRLNLVIFNFNDNTEISAFILAGRAFPITSIFFTIIFSYVSVNVHQFSKNLVFYHYLD